MENLLQSIVLGHKETQKKMEEQTDVLNKILDVQKNELKAEQRREKREAQASKRRKSDESGDGVLGKMLGKEKKKGGGILGTIGGVIGKLLLGLGGLGLVKALGLSAIGATIGAYFNNKEFRDSVNKALGGLKDAMGDFFFGKDGIFNKKKRDALGKAISDFFTKDAPWKVAFRKGFVDFFVEDAPWKVSIREGTKAFFVDDAPWKENIRKGFMKMVEMITKPVKEAMDKFSRGVQDFNADARDAITRNKTNTDTRNTNQKLQAAKVQLRDGDESVRGDVTYLEDLKRLQSERDNMEAQKKRAEAEITKYENKPKDMYNTGKLNEARAKQEALEKNLAIKYAQLERYAGSAQSMHGLNVRSQAFQSGGFVGTVPGQGGNGDRFRTSVAPGSVVLNQTAAGMFQEGGQVPVMLEQGEKVFSPNDPAAGAALMMNSMIGRFQTGGVVQDSHPDTGSGWSVGKDYKGRPSIFTKEAADSFVAMTKASNGLVRATDIASSTRSPQKNASVGGVPNSNHLHGEAVDIHGASKVWMKQNGMAHGWKNLVYSGHDGHFDYRGGGARLVPGDGDEKTARNLMGSVAESQLGKLISGMAGAINDVFGDMLGNMFGGLLGGAGNLLSGTGGGSGVGTGPVDMGADVNEQLMNTAKLAMSAGFNKSEAKTMAAIAGGESTFNNKAHNNNALTGDNSYGLWQINMLGKMGAARRAEFGISSNEDLFNPMTNAKAAKKIYDSQGFGAWGAYKDGNAAKYTNAAQSLQLQNGGVANVRGASSSQSAAMVSKSQEQFAQKIAEAVGGPIVIPVPSGGGGGGGTVVQPGNDTKMPMLPSADNSIMAMEYKYRITMGASI